MFWLMSAVIIMFVGLVIYITRVIVMQLEQRVEEDILRVKDSYLQIIDQKRQADDQKRMLERDMIKIFTLYELTRDITKSFNREEAFQTFKKKLEEIIDVDECLLLHLKDKKIEEYKKDRRYEIFELKGNAHHYGYLVCLNVSPDDMDIFYILAHQFVLALRRIRLYDQIEKMAITDSLTGVYTRRHLMERFAEEIERAKIQEKQLAVLMLDADHFKNLNDQYGHLTGDQVLREIAQMIKESIREIDFVGRYGGEEFCIVLPDTEPSFAQMVAERIRQAIADRKIHAYDTVVNVTVSIGIATFPHDGAQMAEVIDKADWALYRAKKQGRNCVCAFGVYEEVDHP